LAQAATVDDEVVLLGVCQNEAAPVATLKALQNAALATVREAAVEPEFPPLASTAPERRNHREWIARLIVRYRHGESVSPALLQWVFSGSRLWREPPKREQKSADLTG
jgi:hypothetical protein